MIKSELFSQLEEIFFAQKDPEEIERDIITAIESQIERTLARGDPIRLLTEVIVYLIVITHQRIDWAGKQNLLAYSSGNFLDHLGSFLQTRRIAEIAAVCSIRVLLSKKISYATIIPQGTRITPDGALFFSTVEELIIPANELSGVVKAQCLTAGTVGNGFLPGQINKLVKYRYE